jgi:hypothetical protein
VPRRQRLDAADAWNNVIFKGKTAF